MRAPSTAALARRLATVAAVAITGFLCGWQATGLAGGSVVALALAGGVSPAVFSHQSEPRRRPPR